MATINDALGIAKINKNDIFLVNTDLSAAFDTISRKLVIKIMRKLNFPEAAIHWIRNLIEGNYVSLQVEGVEAARIRHNNGIGQ